MSTTTTGFLLGGRVRHDQLRTGHRTGIEPVLLAATVATEAGGRVLEGGSGAGAALLCLAGRVSGITGLGIERDPALVALAQANAVANGFAGLEFVAADLLAWRSASLFDHAIANPPWHAPAGTPSPDAGREAAKRADGALFVDWAAALARRLCHRGTMTWAIAADHLPAAMSAFAEAGIGSLCVLPLWPHAALPARLVLLRGTKGGRAPFRLHAGLVLHASGGRYTAAAEAILRDGAALEF